MLGSCHSWRIQNSDFHLNTQILSLAANTVSSFPWIGCFIFTKRQIPKSYWPYWTSFFTWNWCSMYPVSLHLVVPAPHQPAVSEGMGLDSAAIPQGAWHRACWPVQDEPLMAAERQTIKTPCPDYLSSWINKLNFSEHRCSDMVPEFLKIWFYN